MAKQTPTPRVTGLILAGGAGRRMGGTDKGLLPYRGRPLVAHAIERLAPQVDALLISANRNLEAYAAFGHPLVGDALPEYPGPLAGLAAGLAACATEWLACVPCDCPALPPDLVARLLAAAEAQRAPLAVAVTAEGMQPTFQLCRRELLPALEAWLAAGERRAGLWCRQQNAAEAYFDDPAAFANFNHPEELALPSNATTLFLGGIRPLPPDNEPTGIFKQERLQPVWLGREGLAGDAQADRRHHGGPEKALHQYAVGSYPQLAAAFPAAAALLVPGSMGENLSVPGWDEHAVCVGDVFRLGDARIQVSQPRAPCWKIDRRFGVTGMTRHVDDHALNGWYFRVIEAGEVAPGCEFRLLERPSPDATIDRLWRLWRAHRPDPDELRRFAQTPHMTESWYDKLRQRLAAPDA